MQISSGKTFKLQPLVFQGPCKSNAINFRLLGKISAPDKNEWAENKKEKWVTFKEVNNLIVYGSGIIEGSGPTWWKDVESERPTSLAFTSCDNLQLKSITSINSAKNHISISSCIGVTIFDVTLIAPDDSPNTDGINIAGSSQVNLFDSFIGTGDDCVAINGGCSGINITNVKCGPGHGLSVGSLGRNQVNEEVEHVYVKNCTFNGTQNGARIKTVPTSAVEVSNVKFIGFHGSAIKEKAIKLNCSEVKGCNGIVLEDINIIPAIEGKNLEVVCNNASGTVQHTTPPVSCLVAKP
ncbi:unnamed protein product [Arabis nemorensis]|uniref:Uncharacterized protein n=1 Tax=Arabis nemorensis TaxID=586526 RepID=A0A565AWK1_9BRAS|nr:unnamed protein product [Arabis nemorensis]